MRADDFFAQEEERRIGGSRILRNVYGTHVKLLTQQEAEEYMKDAKACPRCGGRVSIRHGHEWQSEYCKSCGHKVANARRREEARHHE